MHWLVLTCAIVACSSAAFGAAVPYDLCGTEQTVQATPQRILPIDINSVELALALGLKDQIIAVAGVDDPGLVLPEYRADFDRLPLLSRGYPQYAQILSSGVDLVLAGWNAGFFSDSKLTPQNLAANGIASYATRETCEVAPAQPTLASLTFADITEVARLTGREAAGAQLVAALQRRLTETQQEVASRGRAEPVRIFVYDSGGGLPYTAGGHSVLSAVIAAAGGTNIGAALPATWETMAWRDVVAAAPEVIAIIDYGFGDGERKRRALLKRAEVQEIPAVRMNRFFIMPYSAAVSGIRSVGLVKALADHLICSFSPILSQGTFTCLSQPYSLSE